jgi:hypothetical protein
MLKCDLAVSTEVRFEFLISLMVCWPYRSKSMMLTRFMTLLSDYSRHGDYGHEDGSVSSDLRGELKYFDSLPGRTSVHPFRAIDDSRDFMKVTV